MKSSVLIIDDEDNIRQYLGYSLAKSGYETMTARYGKEGLKYLMENHVDVVLLDLNLPDISGLEMLETIKNIDIQAAVIIITAYGDIHSAVTAIKMGAFDYITKPFEAEDIKIVIKKALMFLGLQDRIQALEHQISGTQMGELITRSKKMDDILEYVRQVAATPSTVMIYGETGTGKELIASLIHKHSQRAGEPFVTIDCTALPENLLESELFGHEKGAFTGATRMKRGLFDVASGGTVFLDEIGELQITLQAKILRVLDSREFRRIGSEHYRATDVRIVAATNRNLKEFVKEGKFRSDLFYRLNVVPITLPPLRERKEDIIPLVEHFIQLVNKKIGRNVTKISQDAVKLLVSHDWPGNIRELKNVIEHGIITCTGNALREEHLLDQVKTVRSASLLDSREQQLTEKRQEELPDFRAAKKEVIASFEFNYLGQLLELHNWNIAKSARSIGMHRSSLQRLLRKYGLNKTPE
ncbi:hypothetical protein AAU61_01670 [Desulfocarbo indianensis]|nr:hypothetical protein AAU61_01670 [Desulfocarbo indianensis]